MSKFKKYLPFIVAFRLLSCLILARDYDYPDEYWQGHEIAHHISFGYGFKTWEWTINDKPIRSYLFPLLLSSSYELLKLLGLDNTDLILYAPRMFQVLVCILFDWYLLKLNDLYNPGKEKALLFLLTDLASCVQDETKAPEPPPPTPKGPN